MASGLHVLIAGAGLAGPCLANGLIANGHTVTLFERDTDLYRKAGYRLAFNAEGGEALHECLPDDLYELYLETSRKTPPRQLAVVIDDQLQELSSTPHIGPPNEGPRPHTAVNRTTLRQIMLGRLGGCLRLGSGVVAYEERGERVAVTLEDGSTAEGDILVAADGIHSAIRAQRLPDAVEVPAGVEGLGLFGRSELTPRMQEEIPSTLLDGFVIATNKRGGMLAMGAFNPRRPPAEAAADLAPDVHLDPVPDYMMVSGSVAPGTEIPPAREWTEETPALLRESMLRAVDGWHPALRGVVERIDPATMFVIPFGRLEPTPAWEPSRVTLVGDAIHAMLPTLGQGANTALGDAARLSARLADCSDPVAAIGDYERAMRDHVYPIMEMAADHSRFGGGGLGREPAPDSEVSDAGSG